MFAGLASLGVALIALFLYGYAVINIQVLRQCPERDPEVTHSYDNDECVGDIFLASIFYLLLACKNKTFLL